MTERPEDPRWPRAAGWLAAGPGSRPVDLAVLGIPAYATSLSRTGRISPSRATNPMRTICGGDTPPPPGCPPGSSVVTSENDRSGPKLPASQRWASTADHFWARVLAGDPALRPLAPRLTREGADLATKKLWS